MEKATPAATELGGSNPQEPMNIDEDLATPINIDEEFVHLHVDEDLDC